MDSPMELTSDFMEAEEELEHAPESVVVESELTPEFVAPEELAPEQSLLVVFYLFSITSELPEYEAQIARQQW